MLSDFFYSTDNDFYRNDQLQELWDENPLKFKYILFYLRSHKDGGPGLKRLFNRILNWMAYYQTLDLIYMLNRVPIFGCWKDLFYLCDTPVEAYVLTYVAKQLELDRDTIRKNPTPAISILAKWVPNEGSQLDKKYGICKKLAKTMNINLRTLRKEYLVPIRNYLAVPEQKISTGKWSEVDYRRVSKKSMIKHHRSFVEHDETRYLNHLLKSQNKLLYFGNFNYDVPLQGVIFKNLNLALAIDNAPSMTGFCIEVTMAFLLESNLPVFYPFNLEGDTFSVINTKGRNLIDKIKYARDDLSESKGANLEILATNLKEEILLVFSTEIIDPVEIPESKSRLIFWHLSPECLKVSEHKNCILVDGFDLDYYKQILKGNIPGKEEWYQIKMEKFSKKFSVK